MNADEGATGADADSGAQDNNDNEGATGADAEESNAENNIRPYNLRARGPTQARFNEVMDNPHDAKSYYPPTQLLQRGHIADAIRYVFAHVMTQMTAKAGIKKHGRAAVAALMQEFGQLENLDVYEAMDARTLTKEQRKCALRAINLVKEKRDGQLKGRTVADGSVQRPL